MIIGENYTEENAQSLEDNKIHPKKLSQTNNKSNHAKVSKYATQRHTSNFRYKKNVFKLDTIVEQAYESDSDSDSVHSKKCP